MNSEWAGVDGGGSVAPSMSGAGQQGVEAIPRWWNPLDSVAIDATNIFAYRAQASVGSPWGLAPANYLETLRNWVVPGINDLTEGAGAIPWGAATGWQFNSIAAQWLDTGLIPANDQSWVMFIQFSGSVSPALSILCGAGDAGSLDSWFFLEPQRFNNNVVYTNGSDAQVVPPMAGGNMAVVGAQGYRNGVADGGAIGPWIVASLFDIFIGCVNWSAVASFFITANIQAVLICDDATAFGGADITAIAAAPGGSMHNL